MLILGGVWDIEVRMVTGIYVGGSLKK